MSFCKPGAFTPQLKQALKAEAGRFTQDVCTGAALATQIKQTADVGYYNCVADFIRA